MDQNGFLSQSVAPQALNSGAERVDLAPEAVEGAQRESSVILDATLRIMDILFSVAFMLVFLVLFIVLCLIVKLDSPGPALFRQRRVGMNGVEFEFYKFRSMIVDAEAQREQILHLNEASGPLFKIRNDPRITRSGRWMRKYSLDELPQFLNVLRGEMSVVGPRPALGREVAQYNAWQRGRLAVKPGVTGLWQVSGRSDLTFEQSVGLDLDYVQRRSVPLYIWILWRTVPAVLRGRGAY